MHNLASFKSNDPEVIQAALAEGIPMDWIEAAQKSPIYKMIID